MIGNSDGSKLNTPKIGVVKLAPQNQNIQTPASNIANIELLGELPDSEIGEVIISEELPEKWTYPEIQKMFIEKYIKKQCFT